MPLPNSPLAYTDCEQLYEAALADPAGARVCLGEERAAQHFRFRANRRRELDRQNNRKVFPEPTHPLHGASEWDTIRLTLKEDTEGQWWVYAEKIPDIKGEIEPLSGEAGAA